MSWRGYCALVGAVGIHHETQILRATHFLQNLGSLVYFGNDSNPVLKNTVFLDPTWLYRCINEMMDHRDLIKDGSLTQANIEKIWPDYPPELRNQILAFMEVLFLIICCCYSLFFGELLL
jgi:hypothetical protein